MSLQARWQAVATHGMRAYYLPIAAGLLLAASAFLPWVSVGDVELGGVPDLASFWILGLGIVAVVLASLSIATRRNSRHPLLLVGLVSLAIMFLAYKLMVRAATERIWAVSQALAIVQGRAASPQPEAHVELGIYLGLTASVLLVLFGLTIVVKRVAKPYADPDED